MDPPPTIAPGASASPDSGPQTAITTEPPPGAGSQVWPSPNDDLADDVPTRHEPRLDASSSVLCGVVRPGEVIDRYVVSGTLGSGGLGSVYEAYDPELQRHVALKLLKPHVGRTKTAAQAGHQLRMLREAQAMAKLQHPNVVHVYDVGTHGDEIFIAMERVQGLTLGRWARASARGWRATLDVMVGAAEGLRAAHEAGMVHRDFKPSNVIVRPDGRAQVLDFGLARGDAGGSLDGADLSIDSRDDESDEAMDYEPETTVSDLENHHRRSASDIVAIALEGEVQPLLFTELTQVGLVMGTPPYMAPEQFFGNPVDHRADQFSYCVTLFGMLALRRPFSGGSTDEIYEAVRKGKIRRPSPDATVPRAVLDTVRRGLAFAADDRFATMGELVDALREASRARPVVRRSPVAVSLALVVSATVAGTAIGFGAAAEAGDDGSDRVGVDAEPTAQTPPTPELHAALGEGVANRTAIGKPGVGAHEDDGGVHARSDHPASNEDHRTSDAPWMAGPPTRGDDKRVGLGEPRPTTVDDPTVDDPETALDSARAQTKIGRARLAAGDAATAADAFRNALQARPRYAPALVGLSDARFEQGDYAGALQLMMAATTAAPNNAAYQLRLGDAYFKVGLRAEAAGAYRRARALGHVKADARLAKVAPR